MWFWDWVIHSWDSLHPWMRVVISLLGFPWVAWIIDSGVRVFNALISKQKGKEYRQRRLSLLLKALVVRVFNSIRKTVRFGLSYWFPKKVKWDKFYIKICRNNIGSYYWNLLDEDHFEILTPLWSSYTSLTECKRDIEEYLSPYTTINTIYEDWVEFIEIRAEHITEEFILELHKIFNPELYR